MKWQRSLMSPPSSGPLVWLSDIERYGDAGGRVLGQVKGDKSGSGLLDHRLEV